jgi:hypothetical protein
MPARSAAHLALAALAVALVAGCAPRHALGRAPAASRPAPAGVVARRAFAPGTADLVFARAVQALEARGHGLDTCDAGHSVAVTTVVELETPCGASTCLARQAVALKVGWRELRVEVRRSIFDGATRSWVDGGDAVAVAAARAEAEALARELTAEVGDGPAHTPPRVEGVVCHAAGPALAALGQAR